MLKTRALWEDLSIKSRDSRLRGAEGEEKEEEEAEAKTVHEDGEQALEII